MRHPDAQLHAIATANRLLAADLFESLTEEQWQTPSLCAGWTVREIAAHLVPPSEDYSTWRLVLEVIRFRGNLERMVDVTTRRDAEQPTADLVRDLRAHADVALTPPVVGASGPMSDTAIHLRDAARPLGLDVCPSPPTWVPVLDFLVSKAGAKGFVAKGLLVDVALRATDQDWSWGHGDEVHGTSEALAMAVAGREVVLPELEGAGVTLLTQRLAAR